MILKPTPKKKWLLALSLLLISTAAVACGGDDDDDGGDTGNNEANNDVNNDENNDVNNDQNNDVNNDDNNDDNNQPPPDPLCAEYCALTVPVCIDAVGADLVGYEDEAGCLEACAEFSQDGQQGDRNGDTVQCRIFHGVVAQEVGPEFHCIHASVSGEGGCEDRPPSPCDPYCRFMTRNCPETFGGTEDDIEVCLDACLDAGLEDGEVGDNTGNTVQCRNFHAALAVTDDALCVQADLEDSEVCVD